MPQDWNKERNPVYQVSEFAEKAGVTVRTLHHYDRMGLLKPSGRTEAGYRLYGERDFARLQQIVTLKFIGLPLRQIKDLLDRVIWTLNQRSSFSGACSWKSACRLRPRSRQLKKRSARSSPALLLIWQP